MRDRIASTEFDIKDFAPGTHDWCHLHFSDKMRVPVTLPLAVARGASNGPTVLVSSLVHGDEFEGPSAIADFFNSIDVSALSGTFLGLPLANPWAYAGQFRSTPDHFDGLNLARQFPGDPDGSRTQQHAALLYDWVTRILTPDDVFIDLHSAGTFYEYLSMIGYHPTGDETESASQNLAFAFGFKNVWRIPESPSSTRTFNGSIARSGIPTIGTEVRGTGGLREEDVHELTNGLRNILAFKGMLPNPPNIIARAISSTQQICFAASGLFRSEVDLGARVKANKPLGRVLSIEGRLLEQLTAPHDGQIWAIRRFASVYPDDIAYLIAEPV